MWTDGSSFLKLWMGVRGECPNLWDKRGLFQMRMTCSHVSRAIQSVGCVAPPWLDCRSQSHYCQECV